MKDNYEDPVGSIGVLIAVLVGGAVLAAFLHHFGAI